MLNNHLNNHYWDTVITCHNHYNVICFTFGTYSGVRCPARLHSRRNRSALWWGGQSKCEGGRATAARSGWGDWGGVLVYSEFSKILFDRHFLIFFWHRIHYTNALDWQCHSDIFALNSVLRLKQAIAERWILCSQVVQESVNQADLIVQTDLDKASR